MHITINAYIYLVIGSEIISVTQVGKRDFKHAALLDELKR